MKTKHLFIDLLLSCVLTSLFVLSTPGPSYGLTRDETTLEFDWTEDLGQITPPPTNHTEFTELKSAHYTEIKDAIDILKGACNVNVDVWQGMHTAYRTPSAGEALSDSVR